MGYGNWPKPFVGAHMYLLEPPPSEESSWDEIPTQWLGTRFDAVDVLFISPFRIMNSDFTFNLDLVDGGSLLERYKWVVSAARTQKPNVKIVLEQFYGTNTKTSDFSILSGYNIQTYADSVANFVRTWHKRELPATSGEGLVGAHVDGWDVDIEDGNMTNQLSKILEAVRSSLDRLSLQLHADRFSVSITPAWVDFLDQDVAKSIDYVNMQNYSGGVNTTPEDYKEVMPNLEDAQFIWGNTSETPWQNTLSKWDDMKAKVQTIAREGMSGTYAWRLNSDNFLYENAYQVWLYNNVKGVNLPNSPDESVVESNWPYGGRASKKGPILSAL